MDERAESPEMDERCLAVLHAARIGDTKAVRGITNNISHLYAYAGMRPSRAGMDNLLAVLRVAYDRAKAGGRKLDHLVGIEEAAHYDPETRSVTNQDKAEAAYQRWCHEKRP
jgi:hypothetical protein